MRSRTTDGNETDNVLRVPTSTSFTNSTLIDDGGKGNDLPLTRAHLDDMHLHSTITDQNEKLSHCE